MPRNRNSGARLAITAAAMVGVLVVAACEGNNLFSVPSGPGGAAGADSKAPEVAITAPREGTAKRVGDSILVEAHVTDNVGVQSVRLFGIAKRGDANLGTNEVVSRFEEKTITLPAGVEDTTLTRYLIPTTDTAKEVSYIIVEAADSAGNTMSDTVSMFVGGPDVVLEDITDGQSVQAGLPLSTRISAIDPDGVDSIRVSVAGAFNASILKAYSAKDTARLDTIIPIPAGSLGAISVTATAWNTRGVYGSDDAVLTVVASGAGDTIPPRLKQTVVTPDRMELQDGLAVTVSGSDNSQGSGVITVGWTVAGVSRHQGTQYRSGDTTFTQARTGTVTLSFTVPTFNVDSLSLPDTLSYEVTTWMRDAEGNCGAANGGDTLSAFPCTTLPGGQIGAEGRTGQRITRPVVSGKTVLLPTGGKILDAAVDTARKRLYLSNVDRNRLEVFDLAGETFRKAIGVGSEPWGLAFSRDQDSLWVANSGGTNLSTVDLDAEREVDNNRFLTPDVILFDVELKTGDGISYLISPYPQAQAPAFSDRPQFVAVDSFGNLIFSTKTSLIGNLGTVRKGFFTPGWDRSEAKLFVEHADFPKSENSWAIAHIDSISSGVDTIIPATDSTDAVLAASMAMYDHVPGFPDQVITGIAKSNVIDAVTTAAADLVSKGSDIFIASGTKWDIASLSFQDTTYVAGSGDGGWVAVGEGGAAPVGRVLTYRASPGEETSLTRWLQVADLLTNPSEEVKGIGLNYDGTLGVVRGKLAAYFISPPDLRLQGLTEIPSADIGSGATLHPLHANARTLENLSGEYRPDTQLAFVATGDHTVDIIDTQRFTRIGRVYIRDVITGPLRAVLPFPEDNAGATCATIGVTDQNGTPIGSAIQLYQGGDFNSPIPPDGITQDRCVVIKLFATTSGGGVVVIDVRKADVLKEHPERVGG